MQQRVPLHPVGSVSVSVMYQSSHASSSLSLSTAATGLGAAIFLFVTVLFGADDVRAQSASHLLAEVAPSPASSGETQPDFRAQIRPRMPEIKAPMQPGDELAALEAIDVALTQASDGATYVWRHHSGRLDGAIRMTRTFRNASGQVCRSLQMILNSGTYTRQQDGIACRHDGMWHLEG
jgi:surface antigen